MKRIYTILSCLLLAGMLCIGLYALLDKDATCLLYTSDAADELWV